MAVAAQYIITTPAVTIASSTPQHLFCLHRATAMASHHATSIMSSARREPDTCAHACRVSTLEAVAALLYCLEGSEELHQGLLNNLKLKVDAARLQKSMPAVYATQYEQE